MLYAMAEGRGDATDGPDGRRHYGGYDLDTLPRLVQEARRARSRPSRPDLAEGVDAGPPVW